MYILDGEEVPKVPLNSYNSIFNNKSFVLHYIWLKRGLQLERPGIPISYRLFEGNTHESKTYMLILEVSCNNRKGF